MKTLDSRAICDERRVAVALFHPIGLAIFGLIFALVHFAARQSWGEALTTSVLLSSFLPRGEIFLSYNQKPQWTWLVLRWVSLTEILLLFFALLFLYRDGDSFVLVVSRTLAVLLLARLFAAIIDIGESCYPLDARGVKIVNWASALFVMALLAPLLWATDWHAVAHWRPNFDAARSARPDWRSLAPIGIGVVIFILFVWPPLELWNRWVKPLDDRDDLTTFQRFGVAVAAVGACVLWWALLVFLLFWIGSQPNFAS